LLEQQLSCRRNKKRRGAGSFSIRYVTLLPVPAAAVAAAVIDVAVDVDGGGCGKALAAVVVVVVVAAAAAAAAAVVRRLCMMLLCGAPKVDLWRRDMALVMQCTFQRDQLFAHYG
jgi:hypothetical protein